MSPKTDSFHYHDLLEASAEPGCPLCRLSAKWVHRYLDGLMYESVTDLGVRARLRESLGFCHQHAWRLPALGGASLGIAFIYQSLLRKVDDELAQARFQPAAGLDWQRVREALDRDRPSAATRALVTALQPQASCPACEHRDRMDHMALKAVVEALATDSRLQAALRSSTSAGLCLPHLRRALELARDETAFRLLQSMAREHIARLIDQLEEFIRKNDYRFTHEGFGVEGDSWKRAVAWLVGAEGVRERDGHSPGRS